MERGETSDGANRPWQSYHTVYTNAKAGMDGVDKEKVQKIVYEMSKGSKYFENEERKEAFIKQKIENMRAQCEKLTTTDIHHYQMIADKRVSELEAACDLSRIWLHMDMDAFYAAVETLENPSLRGKPMAVGGISMISTANYEARRFGVRAAMPGFIARKLCPELIFVPTDFKKYTYYSSLTRKVLQKYDPNFMATSLDEAYLDITGVCEERGISSGEIAEELRAAVFKETGLTCSTGVAPNRLLAKVCSDINKPNGQFVLPNDRMAVMTFISSLPIRKIGGIGKVTEHVLRDVFGINTCNEMLQNSAFLCALFSRSSSDFFLSVGLGLGKTDTPQVGLRKSISSERTFSATDNEALLYQKLADIAETLSSDMQKEGLFGKTLTLKLKTNSFEVRTRALSLQNYIFSSEDILSHGSKLLKAELPLSLRLIGLRMSHFNDDKFGPADPTQKTLTNFIISKHAPGKVTGANSSSGSDFCNYPLMIKTKITSSIDSQMIGQHDCRGPLDSNQQSDLRQEHCTLNNDIGEIEKMYTSLSSECIEKVSNPELVSCIQKSPETGDLQSGDKTFISFSEYSGCGSLNKEEKETKFFDKHDAILSLSRNEKCFWVDGYICSLCGIEMPSNFVDERLEHFDYHLAEMLQEEESGSSSKDPIPKQRFIQKAQDSRQSKRRKHKSSPRESKHVPIDFFFRQG